MRSDSRLSSGTRQLRSSGHQQCLVVSAVPSCLRSETPQPSPHGPMRLATYDNLHRVGD